ncbi:flagellar protein FlaG [Paenibacillus sp. FSL K6-1566]|uniref:flagellar protein FlaG n=1 Tax=Paenibacillus TaxID=44249 RepID=UPI00203C077F|nr:flagellar protein FlaG [Paenibacillus lactis]MCM3493475.1 flagellar protein FlaG [Paenibacillus lactis]
MRIETHSQKFSPSHDINLLTEGPEAIEQHENLISENVPSIGEKYFTELIERTNKSLSNADTHLKLSVHGESRQIIVKVINTETDEIIREIPPEKFIDLVYNLCKQVGLIVDERR